MLKAIPASIHWLGRRTISSAAKHRVMLWATVKAVTTLTKLSSRPPTTISASRNMT